MQIEEKNAVVTGASSGIGLEITKLLLKNGCRVVASSRTIDNIGIESQNLFVKRCDVGNPEDVDALFDFAYDVLGKIDIFVSNAGFAYYEKLEKPDWKHIASIVNTNVVGGIYCAEKMKERAGDDSYNFVVTASAMGLLSLPGYALYSGTKAAVRGFADAYRFELGKNQHFQVVYPVATKTKFFTRAGKDTPVPWPTQTAETVAKKVIKGIKRDKKHIFPSAAFRITEVVNRVFPFVFKIYTAVNDKNFKRWLERRNEDV